jgi:molybdate/tungstate transport system substrate-binding protein
MQTRTRRSLLTTVAAGCGAGVAGCLGGTDAVSVLAAGSLAVVFEDHVGPAFEAETGTAVRGEYHGSTAVMRMITDDQKHPDVAVSADHRLLRDRLYERHTDWDVAFASNAVGLAYGRDTWVADRLAAGDPWYEVVRDAPAGDLAISDPALDPLGYRAVLAFRLAEREHGLDDFAAPTLERAYREPEEPQLLAGVETGNRAAAVAYRNMAVAHDLSFELFPPAYNFADPDRAETYASASYTTMDGYTVTGAPIVYNATVLADAAAPTAGRRFVQFLATATDVLRENGLAVASFPRAHGAVPSGVLP